ncbi:MAG: hypothetical protein ACI4X9_01145 [Kiritimatiellia bacterium]
MRSWLIGMVVCGGGMVWGAVLEQWFEPNGVPAFAGRGDLSQGRLVVISDRDAGAEELSLSLSGTRLKGVRATCLGSVSGTFEDGRVRCRLALARGATSYGVDVGWKVIVEG